MFHQKVETFTVSGNCVRRSFTSMATMESLKCLDPSAAASLVVTKLDMSEQESAIVDERFSACNISGSRLLKLTRDDLLEVFPGDLFFGIRQDLHSFLLIVKDECKHSKGSFSEVSTPSSTPCVSPTHCVSPATVSSDTEDALSDPPFSPPSIPVPLKRQNAVANFQSSSCHGLDIANQSDDPKELGHNFKLPKYFGPALDKKLKEGNHLSAKELNAVIDIVRTHVWVKCPNPSVQTRKWLAGALVNKYPEALALKHPYESLKKMGLPVPSELPNFKPELEVYKKLSRAFENKRQSLKRFSEVDSTSDSQEDTEELDEGEESMQAVEKHHSMLLKAMNHGAPQEIVNDLFVRSFKKRNRIIMDFQANKRIELALKSYPLLGDSEKLAAEMLMMMGTYPLASKTAEFITNFDKHAKSLVKYMCQVDIIEEEPEAADVEIVAITHLCDVFITKRKLRLSPAKQQLFLTREDYGKDCSDESTPFLLVTTSDIILMGKQDVPILTLKRDEVSKAVVSLCAAYYAFQLEFPLQAANAYAFLDEFIINSANTSKNSSYRNQVSRYAKFLANSC